MDDSIKEINERNAKIEADLKEIASNIKIIQEKIELLLIEIKDRENQ